MIMNAPCFFPPSPRAWLFASIGALLTFGCGDDPPVEPEPLQESDSLNQPPPETTEARYDMPSNPGSSLSEPLGHCLVLAGFDKNREQLLLVDPGDNLRTGHDLFADLAPHPVRFVRNYLTTVIDDTPATVFGAVLVQPPHRDPNNKPGAWRQTGMPDLSQHASPAWQNFCAPTSAANLMLFFAKRQPKLHPRRTFLEKVEGDSPNPFLNRLIAGFDNPLPKSGSLAAHMGSSVENGTTGLGVQEGVQAYLRETLGSDAGKWQVTATSENMENPDGSALHENLCAHCAAGDGILLFILWGLPTSGGGETSSSTATANPADDGQQSGGGAESDGGGQSSGTASANDGSSPGSPKGTPLPDEEFPEEKDPSRFHNPEEELEDRPAVIVDDFLLEERGGLWYKKGESKPFNGKGRRSYPGGNKLMEIPYRNGKKHGTQVIWGVDGGVIRKVEWSEGKAGR
ncbi:MAG: hypothetical protein CMI32_05900 [Opitutales bacterium]|nr:hypothetical protein [Opitutales bacterium]